MDGCHILAKKGCAMAKFSGLLFLLTISSLMPAVAQADICDIFAQECQDLQDDLDELDAQLQNEIEQFEASIDAEYQQTVADLSGLDEQTAASLGGIEQQYGDLKISEAQLDALQQTYQTASAQAKAYLDQRLALLKQEYKNRRDALLADLQQDFDQRVAKYSSDFSSALNLHRLSQFSYSAQLGSQNQYSESELKHMAQSMSARIGLYASKEGWAVPFNWQPVGFINLEALIAKANETEHRKAQTTGLSQVRFFYNIIPQLYTEARAGVYIDDKTRPFYGAKLAISGDVTTWGFDYEQGELDTEFSYEKWQVLYLKHINDDVSMITQLHRSDYENGMLQSQLSSYELALGYRISTTFFSLLPNTLDLDFIFHAPNYSTLKFDNERYRLAGTDWRFALGLSQAF